MARGGGFLFFLELIAPGLADRTRTTIVKSNHQQAEYISSMEKRLTLGVDGARDTVGKTDVELREGVLGVDRGLREVSNGGSLNHVLHGESLDSLVLFVDSFISTLTVLPAVATFSTSHPISQLSLPKHIMYSLLSCSPHVFLPFDCLSRIKPPKPTLGTHREQLEHLTNLT